MTPLSPSTGLAITNPLVLYRALLATKRLDPDPAQHRLALHLQKLYYRLKDYQPEVDFSHRLDQINRLVKTSSVDSADVEERNHQKNGRRRGILSSLREQKENADATALTRRLTSHESAVQLQSPQGLLLYGEVGTGKTLLVDLLADCLPNRKKRRWHFNTFMLETFARLEQLRKVRLTESTAVPIRGSSGSQDEEHSLLWLARDMISTSPILFLDEFQLPDRAASKILSNLFTPFFHLGGVLIATSNRMPEELASAAGVEFAAPPSSRLGILGDRLGLLGSRNQGGRSENMFSGKGDFAAFLEVLRARCEIWDMEGGKDWRRREAEEETSSDTVLDEADPTLNSEGFGGLEPMASGNWGLGYEQSLHATEPSEVLSNKKYSKMTAPKHYFVRPSTTVSPKEFETLDNAWKSLELHAVQSPAVPLNVNLAIPWKKTTLRVYGRNLEVPRHLSGVTKWTFDELCSTNLGPADYISLASTFHTLILTDVPILTLLQKNEARRLITLLDALYEARCKILISAEAGPDDIFFPETKQSPKDGVSTVSGGGDEVYPETFSEIFQDQTSPFRPNTSSYISSASPPSYSSGTLPSSQSQALSARSILADEDSDFGPVYGAGRSHGPSDGAPGAGNEIGRQPPDFARTGAFTGEDERFAYKRARSRLWEMCGKRWWARDEEGWWRPLGKDVRRWEGACDDSGTHAPAQRVAQAKEALSQEEMFRHGASPFRTSREAPPKFGWEHAWGLIRWGKKAGAWGKGVEGLEERGKTELLEKEKEKENKR
ncbi:hypothetical protein IMSHALPRED_000937 [Imshaugia aleurites]|uniref:AAA+ ATPase domain-containing protein n=1 Tax=Imshaugia aleurites TaxID=172621 RepID=A0A8H3EZQ7_9LECA|nr:hypothetical protein IMSHALPRED_000937 [Imshaugia aleurites]